MLFEVTPPRVTCYGAATLSIASPIKGETGVDYDSVGNVETPQLARLGVTRDADFYLCAPPSFLDN